MRCSRCGQVPRLPQGAIAAPAGTRTSPPVRADAMISSILPASRGAFDVRLALDYAYRYGFASDLSVRAARTAVAIGDVWRRRGASVLLRRFDLLRPKQTADLLRGLMEIVHARFHIPAAMLSRILALADPVVTSSEERLRFEGFSGCCSAYCPGRSPADAVAGETLGRGTTNGRLQRADAGRPGPDSRRRSGGPFGGSGRSATDGA